MKIKVTAPPILKTHEIIREDYMVCDHWKINKHGKAKFKAAYSGWIEREVELDEPYFFGGIELMVDEVLSLRSIYEDQNGIRYMCTRSVSIQHPASGLTICSPYKGGEFIEPTKLTLVS